MLALFESKNIYNPIPFQEIFQLSIIEFYYLKIKFSFLFLFYFLFNSILLIMLFENEITFNYPLPHF